MSEHNEEELSAEEQIARMKAAFDQAKEGLKEIASSLFTYYVALKSEGFTEEEAFALVMAWQNQMISNANG